VTVFTPAPGWHVQLPPFDQQPRSCQLVSPNSALRRPAFTLTLAGSNFLPGSVVLWNGSARPTTFIGLNQLRAAVSATDLASAVPVEVTVFNPAPGGGESAPQSFTINTPAQASVSTTQGARPLQQTVSPSLSAPRRRRPARATCPAAVPAISSFQPTFVVAGSGTLPLRVRGENFTEESVVRLKGKDLTTKFISDSELEVEIPAAALAQPGELNSRLHSRPSGGASKPATLTVTPQP
jgi:hypothetical protein